MNFRPFRALMLQGTGSDVGKSMLAAGLCRVCANRGLRVRPFKPQNMSNNAAVTVEGGDQLAIEAGREQHTLARKREVDAELPLHVAEDGGEATDAAFEESSLSSQLRHAPFALPCKWIE